jgi:hypothetical protein
MDDEERDVETQPEPTPYERPAIEKRERVEGLLLVAPVSPPPPMC